MTILVTGSAGHLGEALMRTFGAQGEAARGIDIKPSPFTDCVGSIADRAFIRQCMAGVRTVMHAATLHKPHIATHSYQDFLDTNLTGTLVLLEEAMSVGVEAFVLTSTTSAFGAALIPAEGGPAIWVTEDLTPIPRNIYGVSKIAAEGLCGLFARRHGLPVIVLKTSRFFPEVDDDTAMRGRYEPANTQANELLNRRADIADIVDAHLLAAAKAKSIGFGRFIISATTPFCRDDLETLRVDAPAVVHRLYPDCAALFAARGWRLFPAIDRVYVNRRAVTELGWRPKHDFHHVLDCLAKGCDFRSPLAGAVGSKGYHDRTFAEGPYPVA
ncbi:NAD(P)-dependent oxidoreductase [Nordella sp. HKS 07]|uniref:NAD-dependent epimerase/dehydratase family protein n=1 Tax=Nordella sp. HKS 07 TaxID=2712222 RepID=UPI0013E183DD|nr:NAD(P)-dependent oxidoreductase [Nordella sp. HKS 07]QIG50889.1 NAD(P)-dependent oxidoreductase [Nordella sp. HKS 07]